MEFRKFDKYFVMFKFVTLRMLYFTETDYYEMFCTIFILYNCL